MRIYLLLIVFVFPIAFSAQDYYTLKAVQFLETEYANDTAHLDNLNHQLLQACIFHATNLRRSKKRQFIYNSKLEKAATFHSEQMLSLGFFSHTNRKNKKYKNPDDRAAKFKVKFEIIGENILEELAIDYKNNSLYDAELKNGKYAFYHHNSGEEIKELTYKELAEKMVSSWMHSPGHKANVMDKNYTHLGIGIAIVENPYDTDELPAVFATQLFGGN